MTRQDGCPIDEEIFVELRLDLDRVELASFHPAVEIVAARGIAHAKERGFGAIVTRVRMSNQASLAMNRRMGFC